MDGQNVNNGFEQQPAPQTEQPVYQQQQPYQQQPVYQQPYAPQEPVNAKKANGLSIAGLIVGIVSICLFCLSWVGSLIGVVGLILSIIGQVKSKSKLGVAAIIVSAIGIVAGIIFLVVIIAAIGSAAGGISEFMQYYNY